MAQTTVKSEQIATNAISGTIIADNAITGVHIAQNAILTQHIDDGQVGTSQLAADAVTGAKLADSSVVTANIQDDQVTGDKLANNITIAGTLASTGVLTANAGVVVDNFTIDGTEIDLSSGDLTLDIAGNIILDADGAIWKFQDGGTEIFQINSGSHNANLKSTVQDKDIRLQGNDGGSTITALTLDMSEAGKATFNGGIVSNAGVVVDNITIDGTQIDLSSGDLTIDVAGNIQLDADDAGEVRFIDGGTTYATIKKDGNNAVIQSIVADGDLVFQGIDGSSFITPMYIDMSAGGNVGIGTSSVDTQLHVYGNNSSAGDLYTAVGPGNCPSITIQNASTTNNNNAALFFKDNDGHVASVAARFVSHTGGDEKVQLRFSVTGAGNTREKVVITEDGHMGIGTMTPSHKLDIYDGTLQINAPSATGNAWTYYRNTDRVYLVGCRGSASDVLSFYDLSADVQRMQIETSGNIGAGGSSTNIYNASDERLKENILPLNNSLDTIKKLNPVKFNWIDNFAELEKGKTLYGFVAQEVQDVFPDAVQPFSDGKPVTVDDKIIENPLTVREKFLVPMLVKAIQELEARITAGGL